jgi:hypothetical protein
VSLVENQPFLSDLFHRRSLSVRSDVGRYPAAPPYDLGDDEDNYDYDEQDNESHTDIGVRHTIPLPESPFLPYGLFRGEA